MRRKNRSFTQIRRPRRHPFTGEIGAFGKPNRQGRALLRDRHRRRLFDQIRGFQTQGGRVNNNFITPQREILHPRQHQRRPQLLHHRNHRRRRRDSRGTPSRGHPLPRLFC